jgi:holo-[acyl-carrier protein] synthase
MKAVGLDAIEIVRVAEAIERHGERFLARVYTDEERRIASALGDAASQFFAGRFAAKEAVLKALGTGYAQGLAFREVEIRRDEAGAPHVALSGVAGERARELGITKILVSITHTRSDAHAVAVAE